MNLAIPGFDYQRIAVDDEVSLHAALGGEGSPIVLLHGFPYDIHSYLEVAPMLAARGCKVIVPYLRGHGPTRFLSDATPRSGEQAAIGSDLIALMDALSVPRAVFAGLFIGIFLMVPGLQIVGAALLSVPMRANIPVAAAMTFLSNPLTTPFFLYAAIDVGARIGFHTDLASFMALRGKSLGVWMQWLLSDAAPALLSGLFLIGLGVALVGYIVSLVVWRWWVGRKWRQRYARPT
jgi:uncharacterized protein (DUF2062 family)